MPPSNFELAMSNMCMAKPSKPGESHVSELPAPALALERVEEPTAWPRELEWTPPEEIQVQHDQHLMIYAA